MNLCDDPVAVLSASCRLPGGIKNTADLWSAFCDGDRSITSVPAPASRCFKPHSFSTHENIGKAGWLGEEGVETFDPGFFNITPAEAETLRPNARLALELTWEALERAGIPPSTLRGKNISVSIGMGTEDGWDLRRYHDDDASAFGPHWAASSDPSGVPGHVAHFFDFHGPVSSVSTGCSSAAFALRDGTQYSEIISK